MGAIYDQRLANLWSIANALGISPQVGGYGYRTPDETMKEIIASINQWMSTNQSSALYNSVTSYLPQIYKNNISYRQSTPQAELQNYLNWIWTPGTPAAKMEDPDPMDRTPLPGTVKPEVMNDPNVQAPYMSEGTGWGVGVPTGVRPKVFTGQQPDQSPPYVPPTGTPSKPKTTTMGTMASVNPQQPATSQTRTVATPPPTSAYPGQQTIGMTNTSKKSIWDKL